MAEIWIAENEDFPVYSIEGPPPAGQEHYFGRMAVQVDDVTLAAWQEAIARFGEVQTEMAQARVAAGEDR